MGKTVIKHRSVGLFTACGRYVSFNNTTIKTNKTWRGVTCKKCLAVRAKATRTNKRTTRKATATTKIGATV